jgi:hypothetical protein
MYKIFAISLLIFSFVGIDNSFSVSSAQAAVPSVAAKDTETLYFREKIKKGANKVKKGADKVQKTIISGAKQTYDFAKKAGKSTYDLSKSVAKKASELTVRYGKKMPWARLAKHGVTVGIPFLTGCIAGLKLGVPAVAATALETAGIAPVAISIATCVIGGGTAASKPFLSAVMEELDHAERAIALHLEKKKQVNDLKALEGLRVEMEEQINAADDPKEVIDAVEDVKDMEDAVETYMSELDAIAAEYGINLN